MLFSVVLSALLFPAYSLAGPSVHIASPTGGKFEKGKSIEIKFVVREAPKSASVGFFLEKDLPREKLHAHPGPSGPLGLKAQPLGSSAAGSFMWDGHSFGCAPTDSPQICSRPAEPGKYRLRAVLFDKAEVWLARDTRLSRADDPKVISESTSVPFEIFGDPDLATARRVIETAVIRHLKDIHGLFHFSGTEMGQYFEALTELSGPDASGKYCRDYKYKTPFAGKVQVCAPNTNDSSSVHFRGTSAVAVGCSTYKEALSKALELAEPPYLKRVRFRTQPTVEQAGFRHGVDGDFHEWSKRNPEASTYLSTGVVNWSYRADGGFWIFVVQMTKAGGSSDRDVFDDKLIVRVSDKGKSCVVRVLSGGAVNYGDIYREPHNCL